MRKPPKVYVLSIVAAVVVVCASTTLALAASTPLPATATGFDISWPQCPNTFPTSPGFGIVGVNDGAPFTVNKCLDGELHWAQSAANPIPAFYLNTGNGGPVGNADWPSTQNTPKVCKGANSVPCSYDYGWNAGVASYADVVNAEGVDGNPSPDASAVAATWWLDVETGNQWETKAQSYGPSATSSANDAAMLEGELAYLQSVRVTTIGVYSTTSMWKGITGGNVTPLNGIPVWIPGAGSIVQAQANCSLPSFTGGRVALIQYPSRGLDGDYVCGLLNTPVTEQVAVSATPTYSYQLVASNNNGAVSFVQTAGTPSVVVSSTGLVTTNGQLTTGTYVASGTTSDAFGDTGTFAITLDVGTIFQAPPLTAYVKVPNAAAYTTQLNVTGNSGPAIFTESSGAPHLVVSSTGIVSTSGALVAGLYKAKGSVSDGSGGLGTFTFALTVGSIVQNAPTTATIASTATATYNQQLSVSRNDGAVTYVQTSGAPNLLVSSTGLVTASGSLAPGSYVVQGTTNDAFGDKGTFVFALSVNAPPPTTTTTIATAPPVVPTAVVVRGHAVAGKTEVLTIDGSNFFGRPIILSHAGTTIVVAHDTGRTLVIRVKVRARSRNGVFVFTITFSDGQTCKVRYVQR
jgi:hypothetical protein